MYMALQEIVSNYNDNLKGRCSICLEKFCETDEEAMEARFSERPDFARIDGCFHRFHLICVYRDWFMQRHVEVDEFGNEDEILQGDQAIPESPVKMQQASEETLNQLEMIKTI